MSDLSDSSRIRQTYNSSSISTSSTKSRPSNVRLGRSQSQAELPFASKFSLSRQQQHQRTILNGSIDVDVSHTPPVSVPSSNDHNTPKMPPSSTTTALMMINKQYSSNSSTYVPTMSNHQQNNTKKIPLHDKRHSNNT